MKGSERTIALVAEEGASLSSGSLRLYASMPHPPLNDPNTQSLSHSATLPLIVGCIDLYSYDPLNRRCAVGIMVANEYRRQGYALAMLRALETQQAASLHTLYADIAAPNTASINLFRKAGYEECGRFKEWLELDSHFIDNIRMQKIL
ncbi:MAG: GNAT family N-acetyltransferase [Bacteroidales bacterium]|nr:GNAT family N-acetyltransferase [Bacteroidales bacterium]